MRNPLTWKNQANLDGWIAGMLLQEATNMDMGVLGFADVVMSLWCTGSLVNKGHFISMDLPSYSLKAGLATFNVCHLSNETSSGRSLKPRLRTPVFQFSLVN